MKEINLPPFAPVLMESTRALGYSLEAAIADVLDNSVSAGAKRIDINFLPYEQPYISILDDGCGMTEEELTSAMRYGSTSSQEIRQEHDLGRFGLGLKTASLSQCRKLTVASKKEGKLVACRWDLDIIVKKRDWVLLCLDENEIRLLPDIDSLIKKDRGTLVIWNNFDRLVAGESSLEKIMGQKMIEVKRHLAIVFHRYLSGEKGLNKIKININNDPLVPHDPFLCEKSTVYQDDEQIIVNGSIVTVRSYILPHLSKLTKVELEALGGKEGLSKNQGFYVYRNKRLLVWGTWFRLRRKDELSKLARIRVDIPNTLDELWTIDIRKSTASPPAVVRQNLSRIVDKIAEGSKRTWTFRGRKETDDSVVHSWLRIRERDGISYLLNRDHPMVEVLANQLDNNGQKKLENLLRIIEMNLPLNHLYLDLANDQKFTTQEERELKSTLYEMACTILTDSSLDSGRKQAVFELLLKTEPFCNYPQLLNTLMEGTNIDSR